MPKNDGSMTRRTFFECGTTVLATGATVLAAVPTAFATEQAKPMAGTGRIRVASVSTDVEGGLLPALLDSFRAESGLEVVLSYGNDPYAKAEKGAVDLVISHFGHRDTERFVMSGFGLWPRTVFSNQLGLFGPPGDPARVRGLPSLVQAFRQIAREKALYVLNGNQGIRYLTDILWHAAGQPVKAGWFIEGGGSNGAAMALAAEKGAYVLWGLTPFQREQTAMQRELVPLLTADPMLQRIMVSVMVNPERVPGINSAGAARLQDYLLSPVVQARMLDIHYPGIEQAVWSPAGRHNAGSVLPNSASQ